MNSSVPGVRLALAYLSIVCFSGTAAQHAFSLPPDPDNAALLYYQAFLLRPEPDDVVKWLLQDASVDQLNQLLRGHRFEPLAEMKVELSQLEDRIRKSGFDLKEIDSYDAEQPISYDPPETLDVNTFDPSPESIMDQIALPYNIVRYKELRDWSGSLKGIDLRAALREYLDRARRAIALLQAGTELPLCDWGYRHSDGIAAPMPQLSEIGEFRSVLVADALLLAAEGKIQLALERSLAMRRFALHGGDEFPIAYLLAISTDVKALELIGLLLRDIQSDLKTLTWLKQQLALRKPSALSLSTAIRSDSEHVLQSVRTDNRLRDFTGKAIELKSLIDSETSEKESMTEEVLINLAAKPYIQFTNAAIRIIDRNDMTYDKRDTALGKLAEGFRRVHVDGFKVEAELFHPEKVLGYTFALFAPDRLQKMHMRQVQHTGFYNRLSAGIDVLLVQSQTGQWPDSLPEGLPRDPFTGKDFKYEKTQEGFTLSFDSRYVKEAKGRRYEFKAKRTAN